MRRIIKLSVTAVLVSATVAGCVKLQEDTQTEIIERPKYDVEIPINPPWDSISQPEGNPVGK